jgi:hypothetical protein
MKEIWKDIEGYEGHYQVSNLGRVKSLERVVKRRHNTTRTITEKILKQRSKPSGYEYYQLSGRGILKNMYTHRLVALSFIPNPKEKTQVNHINGIKTDNRVNNLEWSTPKENAGHAMRTGLTNNKRGEEHGGAKLTEDQVTEIKIRIIAEESNISISLDFPVSRGAISRIRNNKNWKHIPWPKPQDD